MKLTLSLAALLLVVPNIRSEQALTEYNWRDLAPKIRLQNATPVTMDARDALKIEDTNDAPLQVTLLTITNPPISAMLYQLIGEIRYDSVHGDGYLEMWNYFPPEKPGLPEGQYFSRTLGESGEMGKISGTSDWRRFGLPFDRTGASRPPIRLQINLILRGRGTVYLGPVKLVQFPGAKSSAWSGAPDAWWSARSANLFGGWGGGIIGCLGSFCGWLAGRGKARGFVTAVLTTLTGLGVALAIGGIVAVTSQQPYAVWFPLVLGAVLLLGICPAVLWQYRRKYVEMELRRMDSIDASAA